MSISREFESVALVTDPVGKENKPCRTAMAVIDAAMGAGVKKIGVVTDGMRRQTAGGSAGGQL